MTELCPNCSTTLVHASGIGDFCPNPECEVVDNIQNWDKPPPKKDIVDRISIWIGDRLIDDLLSEARAEILRLRGLLGMREVDLSDIPEASEDWFKKAKFKDKP